MLSFVTSVYYHLTNLGTSIVFFMRLLMVLAFCLEANVIFVATQVLTSLATHTMVSTDATELSLDEDDNIGRLFTLGKRDSHQSMVDFLIKNFEFEYTTVRFHFVTGLMSFTIAQVSVIYSIAL